MEWVWEGVGDASAVIGTGVWEMRVTLVQNGLVVESWRLFLLRVAVNCRLDLWSSALVTEVREVGM